MLERPFAAYEGDGPYVFVCYSHDDKGLVYPELTRLKDAGFRIWYDEGISPGSEWSDALAEKIERCTAFLYFVTPRSVTSEHCRREVNFALEQRCRMVAVHLEPTELPSGLKLTLSNRQAILKHDEPPAGYDAKLARAIGDARADVSPAFDHRPGAPRHRAFRTWGVAGAVMLVVAAVAVAWLSHQRPAPEPSSFDRSLAVMPMSVVGDDRDAATYADALTQELRTTVTGYQELRVVSISNAAEAPPNNDASYLVTGSVQRLGDGMRIRANLTRADDRQTVWGKTFEWQINDDMADPAQMATTVGRFVRQQLVQDYRCESVRRTSSSQEAATAYCAALAERGRFSQGGDLDLGLELSRAQRAVALDPNIADAYRIVALNYTVQGFLGQMNWRDAAHHAEAALARGLALAPSDPALLNVQGDLRSSLELDRPGGTASYRASLASDPLAPVAYRNYNGLASLAMARGDLNGAAELFRRALRIYDSDASVYTGYAGALWAAGDNRAAIRVADAGLHLVESGWARAYLLAIKTLAYSSMGQTPQENAALDDALASVGPEWKPALIGPLAIAGRTDQARQLLAHLKALANPPVEFMVQGYAALSDERVFRWIQEAIHRHIATVTNTLRTNPIYSQFRNDPRWDAAIAELASEEANGQAGQSATSPDRA